MGLRAPAADSAAFPARWGTVQESLARIAGIALLTFDRRGQERAATGVPEICRLVGAEPEGRRRCGEWCDRHRDLAAAENRAFFYRCHAGLQCFAAPVRADGRTVGALLGGRTLERAADVGEIEALARVLALPDEAVRHAVGGLVLDNPRLLARAAELATRTATALFTGERLLAEERTRSALLTSLLTLGADFARERQPHEVYAMILDAAAILFDVRCACLLVHDERSGRFRLRTMFGAPAGLLPAAGLAADSPLLEPVLRERARTVTEDRAQIAGLGFPPGTSSLALFPLLAGERVLGILCVIDNPLSDEETSLLNVFSHQAALALDNALLREQLARRSHDLACSNHIRDRLTPLVAWDEVLEAILEEAVQLAGAREASLMLFDRAANTLKVARAKGEYAAVIRAVAIPAGDGIAGRVALEGRPLLVENLESDERLHLPRRPRYRTGSCLIVPLLVGGHVIGVINLADKTTDAPFSTDDLEAVLLLTAQAAGALHRSALQRRMGRLREQAITDSLTGLANRRYLETRLREAQGQARRHGTSFTLTMIDLDDFKVYNDREGHHAGDALLVAVSRVVRASAREIDLVARYGGDELAVLSPATHAAEALRLADRIRAAVAAHSFDLPGLPLSGGVTVSAGVAGFPDNPDPMAIDRAADAALYRAKAAGKNQVALDGERGGERFDGPVESSAQA